MRRNALTIAHVTNFDWAVIKAYKYRRPFNFLAANREAETIWHRLNCSDDLIECSLYVVDKLFKRWGV